MSVNTNQTQINPTAAFFAPAGSSSGGGSLSADPNVSSISTFAVTFQDYNSPGNFPSRIRSNSGSMRIEAQNGDLWNLSLSSLTVSSINGAAPGGGGGSVPGNLVVSSLTLAGAGAAGGAQMLALASDSDLYAIQVIDSTSSFIAAIGIGNVGGRNQVYINDNAEIANDLIVSSISKVDGATISSLTVSSINGAAPGGGSVGPDLTVSTVTGPAGLTNTDTQFVLRQASDGSGRTQLAYNTTDKKGFGTYPFLCPTAPAGIDMGNLCCPLNSNAIPSGFGIGGTGVQGALVFNDPAGANDDWIVGGGGVTTHYALNTITFSTPTVAVSNLSVSSINGAAPALTSGGVPDIAALFSSLFAANPALSTIAF